MSSRRVTVLFLSVAALLGGGLSAGVATAATTASASGATAGAPNAPAPAPVKSKTKPSEVPLPAPVSQTPATYSPNVFGNGVCGSACSDPTVYATAVVNGEAIVAGEFGTVCSPVAGATYAACPSTVPADFIFAFNLSTGAIDPNFTPVIDKGPIYSLAAGPNDTVYLGGDFTTINGTTATGIAQLSVTPGQSTDGQLVSGFTGQVTNGEVDSVAYDGANALYVGGKFSKTDGKNDSRLVRLNATTGALDTTFKFTFADPVAGQSLGVKSLALTPNGATLAIAGTWQQINGQSISRVALINTGGGLGDTAALDNWASPWLAIACSHQTNYVNDVDFSPDGSYFVIADTGFKTTGGSAVCDAAARFETSGTGTDIQPTWVNYTGGDTLHSVAVTSNVVYIGGHNRWANDFCGNNRPCEANTVLEDGLSALDANTGLALPYWHPQTTRGRGVDTITPFPAGAVPGSDGGILIGSDINNIGDAVHNSLAMFNETTTSTPTPGGPIQSGMFSDGRVGGTEESGPTSGIAAECIDDTGNSSTAGTPVELVTCTNDNEQNWTINANETITVNGLCLDTAGEATTSGTTLDVNTCNGSTTQDWTQATGNTVLNAASGLCLDDPGDSTTSGTTLDIATCNGGVGQSWPLPVAQAPPPPPAIGPIYNYTIQSDTDVPCLQKSGSLVKIEECVGQPLANWTMEPNGTIVNTNLCLDTTGEAITAGTLVDMVKCNGSATQVWTPQANNTLVQQGSGMCLYPVAVTNGASVEIETCGNPNTDEAFIWRMPSY
jgi:hypothetical protein